MVDLPSMLDIALHPDLLKGKKISVLQGLKVLALFAVLLLAVNAVFAFLIAAVEAKNPVSVLTLNSVNSVNSFILTVFGVLATAVVATFVAEPLFKGNANYSRAIGFISFTAVPVFFVGILSNIVLFVSALLNYAYADIFSYVSLALMAFSFLWMFYIGMKAVAFSNNISPTGGMACYFMGFVIASMFNTPIIQFIGPVSITAMVSLGAL